MSTSSTSDDGLAIARVLELCEYWDMLGKGEMPVTKAIREAIAGTNEAQNERMKDD